MTTFIAEHAAVIGGSIAGLLAARVLSDHFERVTIIERDRLPQGAELRNGVPQARHIHILLSLGFEIMESLFPQLNDDLDTEGVPVSHWCRDSRTLTSGGWLPRFDSGVITRIPSRALLDWKIRSYLAQNPRIQFLEEQQVIGLTASPNNAQITGVRLKKRGGDEETTFGADLVVDASGRESHAPEWLQSFGYESPEETHVNSFLGYATRWYERPDDPSIDWRMMVINPRPPQIYGAGGILEVEGNRWVVTLTGANKHYPPTDEAGFMDFAQSLATPLLFDSIKNAKPISGIYGYQRTANRWRHYERLSRLPGGFVVLGDAACAFNPIYGQGMTVSAIEAQTLKACLSEESDLTRLPPRFQKRLAKAIKNTWLMATGEDLRYPATEGKRPDALTRLTQRYIDRVFYAMPTDTRLALAFLEVLNLRKPPSSLFAPALAARVLFARPNGEINSTIHAGNLP